MYKKLESLDLEKFQSFKINKMNQIYGGAMNSEAPDGGCTCATGGGTRTIASGTPQELTFTYSSDTDIYNSDGDQVTTDYQGTVYQ
jgi:hypothetical protein